MEQQPSILEFSGKLEVLVHETFFLFTANRWDEAACHTCKYIAFLFSSGKRTFGSLPVRVGSTTNNRESVPGTEGPLYSIVVFYTEFSKCGYDTGICDSGIFSYFALFGERERAWNVDVDYKPHWCLSFVWRHVGNDARINSSSNSSLYGWSTECTTRDCPSGLQHMTVAANMSHSCY